VRDYAASPRARVNPSKLGQVFLNLLLNAAQAIPEGTPEQHEIRVRMAYDDNGAIRVSICDTGIGMTEEVRRAIFTPFFTTKPAGVGTGLGMPICLRLVQSMRGTIHVDSLPGKGTQIDVVLPAPDAENMALSSAPPKAASATSRARVLVIDDEPAVGRTIAKLLGDHDVTISTEASTVLSRLRGGADYDVIICDLMMPGMTGFELHAALADLVPTLARRMVFLTGGAFTARARAFMDSTPCRCLEKPVLPQALRDVVDEVRAEGG
jgi:CheY-like chemotaxis protein